MEPRRYRTFGLELTSEIALPGLVPLPGARLRAPVAVGVRAQPPQQNGPWTPLWSTVFGDGCSFAIELGADGSYRFRYGQRASFHLSSRLHELTCVPADPRDLAWQRVLLDTVLFSVALLRGGEALHAAAVVTPAGAVAIVGGEGGGKSSLAAALLARSHRLLCDDVLFLRHDGGAVVGDPGPALMNLAPARSIGRTLGTLDGEAWVAVDEHASAEPAKLAAVLFLGRRRDASVAMAPIETTALTLLPHSLVLNVEADRLARRFELFSDVAATVPLFRMSAGLSTPPERLADLVETAVGLVEATAA